MSAALDRIAGDVVQELEPLLDTFLVESDLHNKQNLGIQIRRVLWDNKVGILRVLQARTHGQTEDR